MIQHGAPESSGLSRAMWAQTLSTIYCYSQHPSADSPCSSMYDSARRASALVSIESCRRIEALASTESGIFSEKGAVAASDFLSFAPSILAENEFTGVYILHNETKDLYYVGQSVKVLARVKQHLTSHGNGDVYADFKYGDSFTVKTIPLAESGYQSLNDLERDAIEAFDAYDKGYNMTRGNSR